MAENVSVADALERAADLIEPDGAWTQGQMARDAQGDRTQWNSSTATCFCVLGVIASVTGTGKWREGSAQYLFNELVGPQNEAADLLDAAIWNDAPSRTQAEVVAKLREAAALSRTQDNTDGR